MGGSPLRLKETNDRLIQLETDYWGPNKDNGFRSRVRENTKRLDDLEDWKQHFIDSGRAQTCPYLADKSKKVEEDVDVKKVKLQTLGQIVVQLITLIGVLFTAIMALR